MFEEYWWVFVLVIILLMIFYPKDINEKFRNKRNSKKTTFNLKSIVTNIPTITSYYLNREVSRRV
jgi:hypothetical protein